MLSPSNREALAGVKPAKAPVNPPKPVVVTVNGKVAGRRIGGTFIPFRFTTRQAAHQTYWLLRQGVPGATVRIVGR